MSVSRPRRRKRRLRFVVVLPLIGAVVCFGLGVAVGRALHDNPKPGGTQTLVRTLVPLPLAPGVTTVTVTTGTR